MARRPRWRSTGLLTEFGGVVSQCRPLKALGPRGACPQQYYGGVWAMGDQHRALAPNHGDSAGAHQHERRGCRGGRAAGSLWRVGMDNIVVLVAADQPVMRNEQASQIDYFYGSRLASEPGEVEDTHFHPLEPRSFRLSLTKQW